MANIQIYGKNECFDTKKAERFFQERKIKFQRIDLPRYGMSRGELESVCRAVGGIENLIDEKQKDAPLVKFLAGNEAKLEKLLDHPQLLRTPIVRNGKDATVGLCPEVWNAWLK